MFTASGDGKGYFDHRLLTKFCKMEDCSSSEDRQIIDIVKDQFREFLRQQPRAEDQHLRPVRESYEISRNKLNNLCENMNDHKIFATLIGLRALHIYWLDHYQSTDQQVSGCEPWKDSIQWQSYRFLEQHFRRTEVP